MRRKWVKQFLSIVDREANICNSSVGDILLEMFPQVLYMDETPGSLHEDVNVCCPDDKWLRNKFSAVLHWVDEHTLNTLDLDDTEEEQRKAGAKELQVPDDGEIYFRATHIGHYGYFGNPRFINPWTGEGPYEPMLFMGIQWSLMCSHIVRAN
jgi:hypothetical protein